MIGLHDRSCNRGPILPGRTLLHERPFTAAWIAAGAGLDEQIVWIGLLLRVATVSELVGGITCENLPRVDYCSCFRHCLPISMSATEQNRISRLSKTGHRLSKTGF